MKGLELSRQYYLTYGKDMISREFAEWEDKIAVGLVGEGSECFGYDDDISCDHDFDPGFCMFVPDSEEFDERTLFRLERAYAKLPKEFMGFERQKLSPVGGNRRGVMRVGDFYERNIGRRNGFETLWDWFNVPDYYLAQATNGEVFRDDSGVFSSIREQLINIPEDVRRKKLAGHLLLAAQSGQYNYARCISHGELAAAQLAAVEYVKNILSCAFLLLRRHQPYYKWSFRALRDLEKMSDLYSPLEFLLTGDNKKENVCAKQEVIEHVASVVIDELSSQALTKAVCGDLVKHAYSVNDSVNDANIRNCNILFAV